MDPNNAERFKAGSSFGSTGSSQQTSSTGEGSSKHRQQQQQQQQPNNNNQHIGRSVQRTQGKLSPMRNNQNKKQANNGGSGTSTGFFDSPSMSNEAQPQRRRPTNSGNHGNTNYHGNNNQYGNNNNNRKANNRSPKRSSNRSPNRKIRSNSPKGKRGPAEITVVCNRANLFDCASKKHHHDGSDDEMPHSHLPHPNLPVAPYHFAPDLPEGNTACPPHLTAQSVAVVRAPHHGLKLTASQQFIPVKDVIDKSIPNPHSPNICHDKYWAQRRRLFSKFDMGIQLDAEGWYSVTPEVIANHVAQRVGEVSHSAAFQRPAPQPQGIIVLEAFCGCGGNAIAFGKIPAHEISLVVCVDIDRTKLRKAAYNACLYEIPKEKIVFVECSSLFILEHCYQDGVLCIDKLRHSGATLPEMVETEVCAGFLIGGLGMLPGRIDAVFMDPPWGGVDYNSLGKNGYCLEKHMKIKLGPNPYAEAEAEPKLAAGDADDFFDSFGPVSVKQAKKKFNQKEDESEYWTGVDLLKVAASATKSRLVIYDMPRNTSKTSLGRCALAAGYRGNLKLEEHFLNGRLKTVTAYMGADYSPILQCEPVHHDKQEAQLPERSN